mgnify:CR=1
MIEIRVIKSDLKRISVDCPAMDLTEALGMLDAAGKMLYDRAKNAPPQIIVPAASMRGGNGG